VLSIIILLFSHQSLIKMKRLIFLLIVVVINSCGTIEREAADLLVFNAKVYTLDEKGTVAEAFMIRHGKVVAVGNSRQLVQKYHVANKYDAGGSPIYPGFIDAHCHFYGYGTNLFAVDLKKSSSFDEVLARVKKFANEKLAPDISDSSTHETWIIGRGWDQNEWEDKQLPNKTRLDIMFPKIPVVLRRVDGHAVLANSEALRRAGITAKTTVPGGIIELDKITGQPTGILIDNAADLILEIMPPPSENQQTRGLLEAQKQCFAVGLTTVSDAGLSKQVIDLIDRLHKEGNLKMRIYAMASSSNENLEHYLASGPYKTDWLNVRSFKFYGDGALGSRGALLTQPYSDFPGHYGMMLHDITFYRENAVKLYDKGFQMNTHCIGDSANRMILNIYAEVLQGTNDRRWRIEHAQVIHPDDLSLFGKFNIVPSVQPTHATSDMYWLEERLGPERVKWGYQYKNLLNQNGFVANGSDFPVESINPLLGFYAAVSRQDANGLPEGAFNPENALTREEALKAMTIWAAISNFEENEKGSIEPGKFADFVVLQKDIMTIPISEIPLVNVRNTFVNGEKVY
jgi:predicted amidohydrolase YtcJ